MNNTATQGYEQKCLGVGWIEKNLNLYLGSLWPWINCLAYLRKLLSLDKDLKQLSSFTLPSFLHCEECMCIQALSCSTSLVFVLVILGNIGTNNFCCLAWNQGPSVIFSPELGAVFCLVQCIYTNAFPMITLLAECGGHLQIQLITQLVCINGN